MHTCIRSRITPLGFALIALATQPVLASEVEPLACKPGLTHATVTNGYAITHSVAARKQTGRICLAMVNDEGQEVFNDCGTLIGVINAVDPATGAPTRMSHKAVFGMEEHFQTKGDVPLYLFPTDPNDPAPCAFNIGESYTRLKTGTGAFGNGQLRVEAHGVVDECSERGSNTFDISGEACLNLGY
jgi:hypothetical protein